MRDETAIENVIWQILLQIIFRVEFEHLSHVRHWHQRQLCLAEERIVNSNGQSNGTVTGDAESFRDILEMIAEQIDAQALIGRRSIQQHVIGEGEFFPPALKMNGLGRPSAQVNSDDMVASADAAVQKWQPHNERLLSRRGAKRAVQARTEQVPSIPNPYYNAFGAPTGHVWPLTGHAQGSPKRLILHRIRQ